MAKKSIVEREKKRKILSEKYYKLRKNLNEETKKVVSLDKKLFYNSLLQKLPRNSAPSRIV
jgi:small subunit ribosomal protein S14